VIVDKFDVGLYALFEDVIADFRGGCPRGFEE
jgi:hypothetical protein